MKNCEKFLFAWFYGFQVPQFILEEATFRRQPIRIFCTQPRRLPAVTVAGRVAAERNEELGRTVGYHIRLEQKYYYSYKI